LASLGYGGCFKEDEWSPCRKLSDGTLRDGVAIFYKREKLELCGLHAPCTPRASKNVKEGGGEGRMEDAGKCLIARFRVLPPREVTHGVRWAEHTCAMEAGLDTTFQFSPRYFAASIRSTSK
jgi:nocturnin